MAYHFNPFSGKLDWSSVELDVAQTFSATQSFGSGISVTGTSVLDPFEWNSNNNSTLISPIQAPFNTLSGFHVTNVGGADSGATYLALTADTGIPDSNVWAFYVSASDGSFAFQPINDDFDSGTNAMQILRDGTVNMSNSVNVIGTGSSTFDVMQIFLQNTDGINSDSQAQIRVANDLGHQVDFGAFCSSFSTNGVFAADTALMFADELPLGIWGNGFAVTLGASTAGDFAANWSMSINTDHSITFNYNVSLVDSANFAFGTSSGSKIGTSTSQKIGFWNATPIVKPTVTGSRSGGVAITNLLTTLATMGLITNSTSA